MSSRRRPRKKTGSGNGGNKEENTKSKPMTAAEKERKAVEAKRVAEEKAAEEARIAAQKERERAEAEALEKEQQKQSAEEARAAEKQLLIDYKKQIEEQRVQRLKSREKHKVVEENRPNEATIRKLDSSVKKNSAFVKKLRTSCFESQRTSLLNDVAKLNLTKYIPETVAALAGIAELSKVDVPTAVAVSGSIYERYKDFIKPLRDAVLSNLKAAMEADNKKGVRLYLRYYTELIVVGMFDDIEIKKVAKTIQKLTEEDTTTLNFLAVLVSFVKHCGLDVAGIISRKQRLLAEEHALALSYEPIFGEEVCSKFRDIFNNYYVAIADQLVKLHEKFQKLQRKNELAMQLKGDLHEDKQKEAEEMQIAYDKIMNNTTTLADLLDKDMPELPELEPDELLASVNIDISNPFKDIEENGGETFLWEDSETRAFYEKITDMRAHVPEMLFRVVDETLLTSSTNEETVEAEKEIVDDDGLDTENLDQEEDLDADEDIEGDEDKETEDAEADEAADQLAELDLDSEKADWSEGLAPTDPLSLLIERLPTCINQKMIDGAAAEFCQMNNKGNRKRLALALFKVKRTRLDLLPFYARLVAILHPAMPDLADEVVGHLQGEFRFFVRKKIQDNVESKIRNVRFLGELTKFRVCPPKVMLNCLAILLRTFKYHDIDVLCSLLECCGRFLYRKAATHVRIKHLMDIISKKRMKSRLDERQNALISNALLSCNPPARQAVAKKVRPPLHEYFRYLIYTEANTNNLDKVVKKLRRFPWEDPEFFLYAVKCFARVWKVKFAEIRSLAALLAGMSIYNDRFSFMVVDATIEEIRVGMEINQSTHNQRRICAAKYLAEMYNYRLIDSKVVFSTLYSLITYGAGHPIIDSPVNYFRCKLVCTILDTCGPLFSRGKNKRHLDDFLVYFQRYLYTKAQPLPVDSEIAIYDTLELLRPKLQLYETFEEAVDAVNQVEEAFRAKHGVAAASEDTTNSSNQSDVRNDSSDSDDSEEDDDDDDGEDEDEVGDEENSYQENHNEAGDDGKVVFLGDEEEEDFEDPEDDQFVEEFEKMMQDTIQARRNDTASVKRLDVAIPIHLKGTLPKPVEDGNDIDEQKFVFTLLTKKGGKQNTQKLVVPAESGLADRMLELQQAELQERAENKKFVMSYEQRVIEQEEHEARMADRAEKRTRGRRLLFKPGGQHRGRGGRGGRSGFGGSGGRGRGQPVIPIMRRENDRDFEGNLMKDMGYGRTRPENYKGGEAVFALEDE